MISSVLQREFLTLRSVFNIVWTPCENTSFELFIKEACRPCNLITLTETYYGLNDVSVIICNNRLTHFDRAVELAKFSFCPLIIVDHDRKSDIITNKIDNNISIDPIYQIAVSKDIFLSWNKIHNATMEYNINSQQSKNIWKNLIFQLCKSQMVIKDEQITENEKK